MMMAMVRVVMVMVMTTMMKAITLKKMVIIYGDSDEGNDQYHNVDVDGLTITKKRNKLTIMSNLFSSSLTPSTIVIVCPIFTIPLTSLAYGPLPT